MNGTKRFAQGMILLVLIFSLLDFSGAFSNVVDFGKDGIQYGSGWDFFSQYKDNHYCSGYFGANVPNNVNNDACACSDDGYVVCCDSISGSGIWVKNMGDNSHSSGSYNIVCQVPTCVFEYSDWSDCVNGQQTRTIISSTPDGCVGGNPVLSQDCTNPVVCQEGYVRNIFDLNNYCSSGLSIFTNRSYEICQNNQWVTRYDFVFNKTCGGSLELENQYCSGNNLVFNWSEPICFNGACDRGFFTNQTVCEYGCENDACNIFPVGSLYLSIMSPQNITYYNNNTILVNLSSNGNNIWYNWNGANVSYSNPVYINFNNGSNTLNAWATNLSGAIVFDSVNFYIDNSQGNQTNQSNLTIIVHSPVDGATYNSPDVLLNVTSNLPVNVWYYDLDGSGRMYENISSSNLTVMLNNLSEGSHNLFVCGIINESVVGAWDCENINFIIDFSSGNGDDDDCDDCESCSSSYMLNETEGYVFMDNNSILNIGSGYVSQNANSESWFSKNIFTIMWIMIMFVVIALILVLVLLDYKNK